MRIQFLQLIMIWVGFCGVTGFAMGLFAHYVQDLMDTKPADVHLHFNYNAEEMAGEK